MTSVYISHDCWPIVHLSSYLYLFRFICHCTAVCFVDRLHKSTPLYPVYIHPDPSYSLLKILAYIGLVLPPAQRTPWVSEVVFDVIVMLVGVDLYADCFSCCTSYCFGVSVFCENACIRAI